MLRVLFLMLMVSPACAGDIQPKIPSKLGCKIVRSLYTHYSKEGYTLDQMKDHLRSIGLSEERIAGAEKCLN